MQNIVPLLRFFIAIVAVSGSLWSCQQSQLKGGSQAPAPAPAPSPIIAPAPAKAPDGVKQEASKEGDAKATPEGSDPKDQGGKEPAPAGPQAVNTKVPGVPGDLAGPETSRDPAPPKQLPVDPLPPPPTVATPPELPKTPAPLEACTPDRPPTQAYVHVTVTMISNMEHGYHVIEEGAIFQLVQNGKIVIAGLATMEAVRNGRPTDGNGAYPGRVLRLEATYAPQPMGGSGILFMCHGPLGVPPQTANCQNLPAMFPRDQGRPIEVRGQPIQWTVRGGGKLGLVAGDSVPEISVSGGNFNVSAYHPVFAAAAPGAAFKDFQSPLVLDLNNNGQFDLIDVWDEAYQVRFDLKGDGRKGRTGWVGAGDGLLVLDVDQNGTIDSGAELFGEYSVGSPVNSGGKTFENGFLALSQFDSNHDRQIDTRDPIYHQLQVWQDFSGDGISQPRELKRLSELKIESLSLKYMGIRPGQERFIKNNEVRLLGTYKTADGVVHGLADVWFKQRRYTDGQLVQSMP